MSGRVLTIVALAGCLAMVSFALWQRSQTTAHVRAFWGATEASLIQHARSVRVQSPQQPGQWHDLSNAPGLVHLRATLVDDRYYQWSQQQASAATNTETSYLLQFSRDERIVEFAFDPATGAVTNLGRAQSVPLIPASRQAIASYLSSLKL